MKLIRFGPPGMEKPGMVVQGKYRDVSAFGEDYGENFFSTGGMERLSRWLNTHLDTCPLISHEVRLGPPFLRPSKIICIGLNYLKHAQEQSAPLPVEPIVFLKSTSALSGPNDEVIIPKNSRKTDWEVELAVVIGKKASYVDEIHAMEYIAGYCLHNDYSEREFQMERGGQWVKGKSCDCFAPMGPWLVSRDEIKNVHNLRLWLKLNNQMMQEGNTSDMIFQVPFLVHYISQFMTLLPGDVISTGTPSGVGLGQHPPLYLQPGDVVELGIDGLGQASQSMVAFK